MITMIVIPLGTQAQQGLQYLVWSVCLSVKSHLTYGASVHPETLSRTQWAMKICGHLSETTAFKSYAANQYSDLPAVSFLSAKCQWLPNDCQQHSALPKTMPTDATNPCCSEN